MAESDTKYVVKEFVTQRYLQILVHWEGFDDIKDYTWEPKANLKEDLGLAYDFLLEKMKNRKNGKRGVPSK